MSFLRSIAGSASLKHHFTSGVILAAGVGSRFGNADGTKQNVKVGGVPAVVRSVMAFESSDMIDEIVLVCRADEMETMRGYAADYSLAKVAAVVEGGATRAESSMKGFAAVSDKCRFVAIHDAARCLVTSKIIDDTLSAAYKFGAAAAGERVVDTVKIADAKGFISSTPDRDYVWLVKTPQVFKKSVYEVASAITARDGVEVTDDCMMAEHAGFRIKLVDCGHENIKLTSRDDLDRAEYILSKREV